MDLQEVLGTTVDVVTERGLRTRVRDLRVGAVPRDDVAEGQAKMVEQREIEHAIPSSFWNDARGSRGVANRMEQPGKSSIAPALKRAACDNDRSRPYTCTADACWIAACALTDLYR